MNHHINHGRRGNGEPEKTALYRLYDANGRLLYVGITDNPKIRFEDHRTYKHWWHMVDDETVEWFDTRRDAALTEAQAILEEKPAYNRFYDRVAGIWTSHEPEPEADYEAQQETVYMALRARIEDGTYPVGSVIPRQHETCAEFGVANATVSGSYGRLRKQGFIHHYRVISQVGNGEDRKEIPPDLEMLRAWSLMDKLRRKYDRDELAALHRALGDYLDRHPL